MDMLTRTRTAAKGMPAKVMPARWKWEVRLIIRLRINRRRRLHLRLRRGRLRLRRICIRFRLIARLDLELISVFGSQFYPVSSLISSKALPLS